MIGWIVVAVGAAATTWTIVAALRCTIHPGETDPNHPKRIVLRRDR